MGVNEAVSEVQNSKGHNCPESRPSGEAATGTTNGSECCSFLSGMMEGRESLSPGEACPSPGCYKALYVSLDAACLT